MALHKLAFSKICQNERIWKCPRLSRNPHSEEFHGFLRKKAGKGSCEDILLAKTSRSIHTGEPVADTDKAQFPTSKLKCQPTLSAELSRWEVTSWSHAQTWNMLVKFCRHPHNHCFVCLGWWPAGIFPSAKLFQSNDLEEVVCWYHEKKKIPQTQR